jgi:hypothetical protein
MKMKSEIEDVAREIAREQALIQRVLDAMASVIVGQQYLMERILVALLCNGHVLIEGVPGLAKTKVVKSLAKLIDARFQRIQFTPDLLPADLIGTLIYNPVHEPRSPRAKARFLPISYWRTKSTALRPKCTARCWKQWRSARSRWARSPTPGEPVPGSGNTKPDRTGRNLSAPGSADGPLHAEDQHHLPLAR